MFGILLMVIGLGWSAIGVANVVMAPEDISHNMMAVSFLFNGVLFVLPGLVVAGIGSMVRKK